MSLETISTIRIDYRNFRNGGFALTSEIEARIAEMSQTIEAVTPDSVLEGEGLSTEGFLSYLGRAELRLDLTDGNGNEEWEARLSLDSHGDVQSLCYVPSFDHGSDLGDYVNRGWEYDEIVSYSEDSESEYRDDFESILGEIEDVIATFLDSHGLLPED